MTLEQKFAFDTLNDYIRDALFEAVNENDFEVKYDNNKNCYFATFKYNENCNIPLKIEVSLI